MNVFVLDEDPVVAAQSQCDKHVVKMVTETAQLLSTAHHTRKTDLSRSGKLYKACYVNHPWSKWLLKGQIGYNWLIHHGLALGDEYTHRYGRLHKSHEVICRMMDWSVAKGYTPKTYGAATFCGMTARPYCVRTEDQFYDHNGLRYQRSIVEAYRSYYKYKNTVITMRWTNREVPSWLTGIYLAA